MPQARLPVKPYGKTLVSFDDHAGHVEGLLHGAFHIPLMFPYDPTHQVVVCRACKSCIIPGRHSQERHLRAKPHRLSGSALKETVHLLSSYDLRAVAELREHKPRPRDECQPVEHLASYSGFSCLGPQCSYATRDLGEMKKHVASVHKTKAAKHGESAL
jgi:hypothetical protein